MKQVGDFNPAYGADKFGFVDLACVEYNFEAPHLYEASMQNREATIAAGGALVAETGVHTGRSPKDKFVVEDDLTRNTVWWDNNGKMSKAQFDTLLADFISHAKGKHLFAQDLYGGADHHFRVKTRVFTEYAWHSLFIRTMLIRPERDELAAFVPELTIVDLPSFRADPKRHGCRTETVIAIDFSRKIVLIGGSSYAGEMKKSVFTYLNYVLPAQHVALFAVHRGVHREPFLLQPLPEHPHHLDLVFDEQDAHDTTPIRTEPLISACTTHRVNS